jgi:chromosome segregation ATPase
LRALAQRCEQLENLLKETRTEAHQDLEEAHQKSAELSNKLTFLSQHVQELKADKERAVAGAGDELQQTLSAKDAIFDEFMRAKEDWSKVRAELEGVITDVYNDSREKEQRLSSLANDLASTSASLAEVSSRYEEASSELTASKVKMVEAVGFAQTLHVENLALDEKLRTAEATANTLRSSLAKATYELEEARDEMDSLSLLCAAYAMDASTALDAVKRLVRVLAALE